MLYQNIFSARDVEPLGDVDMVVTGQQPRSGDRAAVAAIRERGAKPYRYFQSYWYPAGRDFEGIDIGRHPDWVFCKEGSTGLVGRTQNGIPWQFIDANEKGFIEWLRDRLQELKAAGYDGIMFDRGRAALTGVNEPARIWNRRSTCTDDPVKPGATFADAYVGMMAEVRAAGLELFQNYGDSPFDPLLPFRPDPADANCPLKPGCKHLDDGFDSVSYFLDEAVVHPHDDFWQDDYDANLAGERDPRVGGKVVGLITQGTLGGDASRDAVFFEYGRVRLFDVPLAIFTGYDKCGGRLQLCNRLGSYPELTDIRWGKPLAAEPTKSQCESGSKVHCLWSREYENGVVVVNVSEHAKSAHISLEKRRCGTRTDLFSGAKTDMAAPCAASFDIDVPAWGARPQFISAS